MILFIVLITILIIDSLRKEEKMIKKRTKRFKISRFSLLIDDYDDGITAKEIESMLNKVENQRFGFTQGCYIWGVKEIKRGKNNG